MIVSHALFFVAKDAKGDKDGKGRPGVSAVRRPEAQALPPCAAPPPPVRR
ncbi:hypothetical protein GCM10027091_67870 [Streptomyces daliensis]